MLNLCRCLVFAVAISKVFKWRISQLTLGKLMSEMCLFYNSALIAGTAPAVIYRAQGQHTSLGRQSFSLSMALREGYQCVT